jgi:hypothetical protein
LERSSSMVDEFEAKLLSPAKPGDGPAWAFVVLPKEVSAILPRRGRTSVEGSINGYPFKATLEPDGHLSHWLKVDRDLQSSAGIKPGDAVKIGIAPAAEEFEPEMPPDFQTALERCSDAYRVWHDSTTLARVDWIHWITSAKQKKTRAKRVNDACEMLAAGKKRVCCFDPSGFYSKAFQVPQAAE